MKANRKVLKLMLALVMVLALIPAAAYAEEASTSPENGAKAAASALSSDLIDVLPLTLNDDFNVPDVEYTAPSAGYYQFVIAASFDAGGNPCDMYVRFFEDDTYIGFTHVSEGDDQDGSFTLYMKQGKEYRMEFEKHASADATGSLSVYKVSDSDIDDQFTVSSAGVLESYSGDTINVRIPEGVKSISGPAFKNMSENNGWCDISIYFPSTLESIDADDLNDSSYFWDSWYALRSCRFDVNSSCSKYKSVKGIIYTKDETSLVAAPAWPYNRTITIPDGVESIESNAFAHSKYSEVTCPDSLEVIDDSAFTETEYLESIEFGSSLKKIGSFAFSGSDITSVTFPASLETIGNNCFHLCYSLEEATFNGKTLISDEAFYGCQSLQTININGNIDVEIGVFSGCPSITEASVGSKATEWKLKDKCLIQYYDSKNHDGGEQWTENRLFLVLRDYDDESFVMDNDIEVVCDDAFYGVRGINKFTVGKSCRELDLALDLESISVASGNSRFSVKDDALYFHDPGDGYDDPRTILVKYPMKNGATKFTVPGNVTGLGSRCFAMYSSEPRTLKTVYVPKSVIDVGYGIFEMAYYYDEDEEEAENPTLTIVGYKDTEIYYYYLENEDNEYQNLAWKTQASTTYKVTFNPNGGKVSPKTLSRAKNAKLGTLPTPTRSGMAFMGWYTAKSGGTKITANTTVTGAVTYYAHWGYTVKFDANGGKASKASKKVNAGSAVGTLPTATKSKKVFSGWYTKKSGGTKVTEKTKISANKTFYAHWTSPEIGKAKLKVKNCTWTGKKKTPEVTVTLDGTKLKKGTDYTVTYSNNIEPGKKAKVVVKGKGLYAKSKKKLSAYFTIYKADQVITASGKIYAVDKKGFQTLSIKVKEKATITLKSSDSSIVKISTTKKDKKKGNIKLVAPGKATITIKTAATKHYKAGSKKITVGLKGSSQTIKLNAAWLTYDSANKVYKMTDDVFGKLLTISRKGNAPYTCLIESSGSENEVWFEKGNLLTAKGNGDFKIKVTVDATDIYPAKTEYFTIRKSGLPLTGVDYLYRETAAYNVAILKYIGNAKNLTVPADLTLAGKPRRLTQISDSAFAKEEGVVKLKFLDPSSGTGITKIGNKAFAGNRALMIIRLPSGATSLGDYAFDGCTNLQSIDIPNKIKTIGAGAFRGCTNLQGTIYLPLGLSTLGDSAFEGCQNIRRLLVYSYIKSIGTNAFKNTSGIKSVYYSASKTRWNQIQWGSGNDSVKSHAGLLCNVGASVTAYEVSDISTKTLLTNAPEYLHNPGYEFLTNDLTNDITSALYSKSDLEIGLAALKSQMSKGITSSVQAIFEDMITSEDDVTWSQEKLEKDLALELITNAVAEDEVEEVKKDYMDKFNAVYTVAGTFKSEGDKIFNDNTTRWRFAQELDGYFEGRQASDINTMLKTIQPYWKPDSSNPKPFTLDQLYSAAGTAIDATDYVVTVLMLNELYSDYINRIIPYLPEDSGLYRGCTQLKYQMDQPLENWVLELLKEKTAKELAKIAVKEGSSAFGFDAPVVKVATTFYKVMSYMIDSPTIDEYNKAWLSLCNTQLLDRVFDDINSSLVSNKGGDITKLTADQKMIAILYFESIRTAESYCRNCVDDPAYMDQHFDRYDDSLIFDAYIRSCKENLADSNKQ